MSDGYTEAQRAGSAAVARLRWRATSGLVGCAATLVVAGVKAALPAGQGPDYTRGFAPLWVTAGGAGLAAVALLLMRRWPREELVPRGAIAATGWSGCALLVWAAGGVVFDLLRAAAVVGLPGLPPVVDWPGFVLRAAALTTLVVVATATVAYQRVSRGGCPSCGRDAAALGADRAWFGYVACVLALPYPSLKVYWALGGGVASAAVGNSSETFPVGEIILFAVAGGLALALVQQWGRVFPRWLLLSAGWVAAGALVSMGALAGFGSLARLFGVADGPVSFHNGAWIVSVVYTSWLLLGLALGGATLAYQRRTRPPCSQCGQ